MLVLEVLGILVGAVVLITVIISVGGPVATMLANKTRYKYDALGTESEVKLRKRLDSLEEEMRDLRKQLADVRETSDFAMRLLEDSGVDIKQIEDQEKKKKKK